MIVTHTRVFYVDGTVQTATPATWHQLPRDGVLIVVLYFDETYAPDRPYRQMQMGNDAYHYTPSTGVYGHSDDDPATILARYGADTLVLRGQWATHDQFTAAIAAAQAAETRPA